MALTKSTNRMTKGAYINIKDFESLSSGGTDWQPAIQAAIDSLDSGGDTTTGGVVYFPVGRYYIRSPIIVRCANAANLASITLQGEGMHNTVIDCAAGFTGDQAIQSLDSTYCVYKDFHILGNNRTSYGLELESGGSEVFVERVFCQNFTVSCFYVHRCFMVTMTQCRSKGGVTGFDFSGDYNTSLNVSNCYALSTNAAGQGFLISDVTYSNFTACGADLTGRYGYRVRNVMGVNFDNCGAEQPVRSAWFFEASAALDAAASIVNGIRCSLNGCVSVLADQSDAGYGAIYSDQADTSSIDVEVNRFSETGSTNLMSTYSVTSAGVDLDHKVSLNGCKFTGYITSTVAVVNPIDVIRVNDKAVTGANTPIIELSSIFGSSNNYTGILHVLASNGTSTGGSAYNSAAYVLLVTKSTGGSSVVEIAKNGLTTGGSTNHPSFTWTLDLTNNDLEATPIGSTSGNFYFYIGQLGALSAS